MVIAVNANQVTKRQYVAYMTMIGHGHTTTKSFLKSYEQENTSQISNHHIQNSRTSFQFTEKAKFCVLTNKKTL